MNAKSQRKIDAMHRRFGITDMLHCRSCCHCIKVRPTDRQFYKCELYGDTNSESTDWRVGFLACGMFDRPVDMERWVPVIDEIKHAPKPPDPPLEGQMTFSAYLSGSTI